MIPYGFAACMDDGGVAVSPFQVAPGSVWFNGKSVPCPSYLMFLWGAYLVTGEYVVIGGAGLDYETYVVGESGRVIDCGRKFYNSQIIATQDGVTKVAWYTAANQVTVATLDPATFTLSDFDGRTVPTSFSAGLAGFAPDWSLQFFGTQPPTLDGLPCNRQVTASGVTLAQGQSGGIVMANALGAGVLELGQVTFEPMPSPNGQFFIARGNAPTMWSGAIPPVPPPPPTPDLPPVVLEPSIQTYYLAPLIEVKIDTFTGQPIVSTDAGTNAATMTDGYVWSMLPGGRQKFAFADQTAALPTVPAKWLKSVYGSIESAGRFRDVPLGAPIDLAVRDLKDKAIKAGVACVLTIDGLRLKGNEWALKRWFLPEPGLSLYCGLELYPDKAIGLNAHATYEAWVSDAETVKAFNPALPLACAVTAYTQSNAWPVAYVRELQPYAKRFVNDHGVLIVQPFAISRPSGVTTYPAEFWPIIEAWIATNGAGPLPDLLYAQPSPPVETTVLANEIRAAQIAQRVMTNNHGSATAAGDWVDQIIYHTSNDLMTQRGLKTPASDAQNLRLMALMSDGMGAQEAGDIVFGPVQ